MERAPFGRTNLELPRVWLRLEVPEHPSDVDALAEAARRSGAPLDVTAPAALWGSRLRDASNPLLVRASPPWRSSASPAQWLEAYLFETLCSLQRDCVEFVYLRIGAPVPERQIAAALAAIEDARAEGHVRFCGLEVGGDGSGARAAWHLHDAFETVMVPDAGLDESTLRQFEAKASERRAGLVECRGGTRGSRAPQTSATDPVSTCSKAPARALLVPVRRAEEIAELHAPGSVLR